MNESSKLQLIHIESEAMLARIVYSHRTYCLEIWEGDEEEKKLLFKLCDMNYLKKYAAYVM